MSRKNAKELMLEFTAFSFRDPRKAAEMFAEDRLVAAGYAACFPGTLGEVARTRKLPLTDARITARVTLNITDDKRYVLGAELCGNFVGVSDKDARALMDERIRSARTPTRCAGTWVCGSCSKLTRSRRHLRR